MTFVPVLKIVYYFVEYLFEHATRAGPTTKLTLAQFHETRLLVF